MFSLGGDVRSAELYVVMGRSPLCADSARDPWSSPTYLEDYQGEGEEAVVAYLTFTLTFNSTFNFTFISPLDSIQIPGKNYCA